MKATAEATECWRQAWGCAASTPLWHVSGEGRGETQQRGGEFCLTQDVQLAHRSINTLPSKPISRSFGAEEFQTEIRDSDWKLSESMNTHRGAPPSCPPLLWYSIRRRQFHCRDGACSYQHGELSTQQLRAQRLFLRLESDDSFLQTRFLSKAEDSRWGWAAERLRHAVSSGGNSSPWTMRTPLSRTDSRSRRNTTHNLK